MRLNSPLECLTSLSQAWDCCADRATYDDLWVTLKMLRRPRDSLPPSTIFRSDRQITNSSSPVRASRSVRSATEGDGLDIRTTLVQAASDHLGDWLGRPVDLSAPKFRLLCFFSLAIWISSCSLKIRNVRSRISRTPRLRRLVSVMLT